MALWVKLSNANRRKVILVSWFAISPNKWPSTELFSLVCNRCRSVTVKATKPGIMEGKLANYLIFCKCLFEHLFPIAIGTWCDFSCVIAPNKRNVIKCSWICCWFSQLNVLNASSSSSSFSFPSIIIITTFPRRWVFICGYAEWWRVGISVI